MIRILYPIDLGCELSDRVEKIKFNPPANNPLCVEIKVYKFGIGVVDFLIDDNSKVNTEDIQKTKLPNRMLLSTYKKRIEKYLLKAIQPYRLDQFSKRYDSEFFYPVSITQEKTTVSEDKASIPMEYLDVLKLAIAQYWNLVSYDVFLNQEVDFAINLLNKSSSITLNFVKIIKDYYLLFKEGKEFYRDKLNIVNSLYSFTKENPYNSSPEFLEFYKRCRVVMGLDELEKSVTIKIDQVSGTYSFLGENLSTLFFIIFELGFFLFLFWGVVDTFLLFRIGSH